MRFFSKLTIFCNICFLVAVVIWYVEMNKKHTEGNGQLIPLPWLEGTLVIIGYGAIIINLFFLLVVFIIKSFQINVQIPAWIIIFNILLFGCQVYFHFFLK